MKTRRRLIVSAIRRRTTITVLNNAMSDGVDANRSDHDDFGSPETGPDHEVHPVKPATRETITATNEENSNESDT